MSALIRAHLNELKSLVLSHLRVYGVSIRREEVTVARGSLRVRLLLQAQAVVEVFVYLVERGGVMHLQEQPPLAAQRRSTCAKVGYGSPPPRVSQFPIAHP